MLKILVAALALSVAACAPDPTATMAINTNGRVKVERIAVIPDDLAYGDRRGVYVITDSVTGAQFIGVSGVGITEVGSHRAGKQSVRDER